MTLGVSDLQSDSDLDSVRNSCDVLMIPTGYWLNQYPDSNNLLSALSNFYSSGGSSKISLIDLYYIPAHTMPRHFEKKTHCTMYIV